MKRHFLDLILLVAIFIGGVLAWRSGAERTHLTATYGRMAQVAGDLPINDPTKVYFRALDTGEKGHFAWRVYYPATYHQILSNKWGSESSNWSNIPTEYIARVRIRDDDKGRLEIYTRFAGGSSRGLLGDKALGDFLRTHWDKIQVEQLGTGGVAILDPTESAVVLRLTVPDALRNEARRVLDPVTVERHLPVLMEYRLGKDKTP